MESGIARSAETQPAPEELPKIVTLEGSASKLWMWFWTQVRAISWSRLP